MIPAGVFVGFEDELMAFSDLNYNDEDIVFEDVSAAGDAGADALLVTRGRIDGEPGFGRTQARKIAEERALGNNVG